MNRHERRRLRKQQRLARRLPVGRGDPADALHLALQHHQAGHSRQAEVLCRKLLDRQPDHAEALNLLAIVLYHDGQQERARDLVERALAASPKFAGAHNTLGNMLLEQGELDDAAAAFGRALEYQPDFADARNNLGNVYARKGRVDDATACYRRVIEAEPNHPDAHYNLGNVQRDRGRFVEAEAAYRRALALRPRWAQALVELGRAQQLAGRLSEASKTYRRAVSAKPDLARAHGCLADCLTLLGWAPEAEACFRRALEIEPRYASAASGLGILLATQGQTEDAIAAFERALAVDPEHATASHMKAALTGAPNRKAPQAYVKTLFDSYAGRFDRHLVEALDYRVPQHLRNAVSDLSRGRRDWRVLDVGCGTGLCGLEFRPLAKQLVGIDLAPLMVAKARERGVYDQVYEAELTEFLDGREGRFDLAVAGDVFIYVGALEEVFSALGRALEPGSLFALSIERSENREVTLRPTGRFAHGIAYLERLGREHGFITALNREVGIRKQDGEPIPGNVLVMTRQ